MYISHMRIGGRRLLEAIDELIEISRRSGAPAEIYHLKQAGRANWGKLDEAIATDRGGARARACGSPPTCTPIPAGATGLDASMPLWVQAGGLEAWVERLHDPADPRARRRGDAQAGAGLGESLSRRRAGRDPARRVSQTRR